MVYDNMIDKDMKRKDLQEVAGISSASVAKLGKGDNITTDVLLKICRALDCDIADIMEISNDDKNQSTNDGSKEDKTHD